MIKTDFCICPVCGKEFIGYPNHAYRGKGGKKVCTYSCMLKAKAAKDDGRAVRVRYTVFCPDGYVAKSTGDAARHMGIKPAAVLWLVHSNQLKHEAHYTARAVKQSELQTT